MITPNFEKQVRLLLNVLDDAVFDKKIALKGGTAINLFVQEMPRLSVDIDLTYLLINSREEALADIDKIANEITESLSGKGIITQKKLTSAGLSKQIIATKDGTSIKIDINHILRGTVYPPIKLELCKKAQEMFQFYTEVKILSFEDLYAGKFVAALDRQHPRDLFDVKIFLENHQWTEKLKKVFIVYLLSANRPISELIKPNYLNQKELFVREFQGMIDKEVKYEELEEAREKLVKLINSSLTELDKEFLLSFKDLNPRWELLGLDNIKEMPAIKWKLYNLSRMDTKKRSQTISILKDKL